MLKKHLLLIDDDIDDQFIFIDVIKEIAAGIECATANNGLLGLNYLKQATVLPSLIFLDLNMPFMNGFHCLEKIRAQKFYDNIPIVIYSTSDSTADINRTKNLGADYFFTKTPDFSLLKSQLVDIFNQVFHNGNTNSVLR